MTALRQNQMKSHNPIKVICSCWAVQSPSTTNSYLISRASLRPTFTAVSRGRSWWACNAFASVAALFYGPDRQSEDWLEPEQLLMRSWHDRPLSGFSSIMEMCLSTHPLPRLDTACGVFNHCPLSWSLALFSKQLSKEQKKTSDQSEFSIIVIHL